MSRFGTRLVLLAVFLGGAALAIVARALGTGEGEEAVFSGPGNARVTSSFILAPDRWTVFRLPSGQWSFKVVSNANVPVEYYKHQGFYATYAIQYQLLGSNGTVLRDQQYTLRSGFLIYRNEESGTYVSGQYYLGVPFLPLGSRPTFINTGGLGEEPTRLRIRLAWTEPAVRDVAVRVYQNEKPTGHKLRYLWQRMSEERKRRLARANVYTIDLLTEAEKRNLLENRWTALAPSGVEGRDYVERKLYTVEKEDVADGGTLLVPRGLYVDEGMLGVIPLPEDGGCFRLEVERLCFDEGCGGDVTAMVTWFGPGTGERRDSLLRLVPGITTVTMEHGPGLLEICPTERVVLRAFDMSLPQECEITPEPECVSGFALREREPLEFSRGGPPGSFLCLRVDLRNLVVDGAPPSGASRPVRYEVLDASASVIRNGQIEHCMPESSYDGVIGINAGRSVSDATRRYLWLGPECASIRFFSPDPTVILTAYTRPSSLERRVRVPEDYVGFDKVGEEQSDWFFVRPTNYAACLRDQRETVLKVQRRPSRASRQILTGEYYTQVHEPVSGQRAYRVVEEVADRLAGPLRITGAHFVRIQPGQSADLVFEGLPGADVVAPRALWFKSGSSSAELEIRLDGSSHLRRRVASDSGELEVAPFPRGRHLVEFVCDEPCILYLNGVVSPLDEVHVERTVNLVGREGLSFRVPRAEAASTTLALRLYRPAEYRSRVDVRVTVDESRRPQGVPLPAWTFGDTLYALKEPRGAFLPLLGADGAVVAGGEPFFLTLGPDLPGEEAEVRVAIQTGPPCYLQVAQLLGGLEEIRAAFREVRVGEATDE